jgi:hypothetical protein
MSNQQKTENPTGAGKKPALRVGDGEDGIQSGRLTMERTFLLTVESE